MSGNRTSEIKFTVTLDENNLPVTIDWEASDAKEKSQCKSMMVALWDANEQNTLRIDLWTRDMLIDEMKRFFHQNLLTMADTFERSTGEKALAEDLRDYCAHFAEKLDLYPGK
jgi:gliding motility-associated protein GldC